MCNDFVGVSESILPITCFFTNVSLENQRQVKTICKLMIKELYAIFNRILNLFDGKSWDEFPSVSSGGVSSGDVFFWSCFSVHHMFQDYFIDTRAILQLPHCQWNNPEE